MPYIKAKDVHSPRSDWTLVKVIHDPGPRTEDEGRTSWCYGFWGQGSERRPVLASRWNGSDEPGQELGYPNVRGLPVWYVQPDETYEFLTQYLGLIVPDMVGEVRSFLQGGGAEPDEDAERAELARLQAKYGTK